MKKTWIKPQEAVESSGWMFSDGLDVLKLCLHRLAAKAAKVSDSHFRKKPVYCEGTLEEKKCIFRFRTSKGE